MTPFVLALVVLAAAPGGARAPREVWITIERDVLSAFEAGPDADAVGWADRIEDPLRMRPDVVAAADARGPHPGPLVLHPRAVRPLRRVHGPRERARRPTRPPTASRAATATRTPRRPIAYTIDSAPMVNALIADLRETYVTEDDHDAGQLLHPVPQLPDGARFRAVDPRHVGGARGRPRRRLRRSLQPHVRDDAALGDPHHHGHDVSRRGAGPRRAPGLDRGEQLLDQPRARRGRRRLRHRVPDRGHPRGHGPRLPPAAHGQVHGLRGGGSRAPRLQGHRPRLPRPAT